MRVHSFIALLFVGALFGNPDSAKLSEAIGHMIGKNLQSLNVPVDMDAIAKGMQDEAAGIASPMTDETCVKTLLKIQEQKEMQEAVSFLEANRKREGVVCLQEGKLQFEILKPGKGEPVQSYNSPWVRLKPEGGAFAEEKDEIIALDEAIPGLKFGIVGMQEGEIRKLYIHPDLSYGKGSSEPFNSLLTIEVEILKADASSEAHAASNADSLPILRSLDDERPPIR